MNCPRCKGLMVIDAYLNLEGDGNRVWIEAWRCINCGEVFDAHLLRNRLQQRQRIEEPRDKQAA